MLYEAADVADAFRTIGSKCRTPAAVRARVRTGYMVPDEHTPRGTSLWTSDGMQRELLREARLLCGGFLPVPTAGVGERSGAALYQSGGVTWATAT